MAEMTPMKKVFLNREAAKGAKLRQGYSKNLCVSFALLAEALLSAHSQ